MAPPPPSLLLARPSSSQANPKKTCPSSISRPSTTSATSTIPKTVGKGKYEILRKLGEGCFGEVFSGIDSRSGDAVAVKFEASSKSDLMTEVAILKKLGDELQGFTRLHYYGKEGQHNCLVMERLGRSLMDLHKVSGGKFSAQTTVLLAQQSLRCLEVLHSCGIVHRDIKPENFMCGIGQKKHHIYLIDFGMATPYYSNGKHTSFHVVSGFSGNLRYASINAHRMYAQSRRDDLEAMGHMLYFFLLGRLPWSGLPAKNWKEQNKLVMEKKESTSIPTLNSEHPTAFKDYLAYSRGLGFVSKPDYAMLDGLFKQCRQRLTNEGGRPLEDNDVEWVQQFERSESISPLQTRATVAQPDETSAAAASQARATRGFGCPPLRRWVARLRAGVQPVTVAAA